MVDPKLIDACDRNSAEALRHFTGNAGGEVVERDGVLLAASPHPYCGTFHNAAVRLDRATDPTLVIEMATEYFLGRQRCFVLWTSDMVDDDLRQAADAYGLPIRRPADGAPVMIRMEPLAPVAIRGVDVVPVTLATQAPVFAAVVAEAYTVREQPGSGVSPHGTQGTEGSPTIDGPQVVDGPAQPMEASLAMFADPAVLLAPETFGVIAYEHGRPLSAAVLYQSGDVGGVYWVSTVKEGRRRGLADLVTRVIVNEAFRRGARLAALQASSMGKSLYDRMGFVEIARHRRYLGGRPLTVDGRVARPGR